MPSKARRRGRPSASVKREAWATIVALDLEPFSELVRCAAKENDTRAWDRVCAYLYAKPKQVDGTLHLSPEFKITLGGE